MVEIGAGDNSEAGDKSVSTSAWLSKRGPFGIPVWVYIVAAASTALTFITNINGIASGDDGVGYRAIADSILAGEGLRYFLEDPLTVWPPIWPALMAGISKITPLNTVGASIVLNAITVFAVVLVGFRLLTRTVANSRLVLLGTLVIGFGSSTMGFGHLLMTDFAFAVVVMAWMLCLMNFHDSQRFSWLASGSTLVWLGFGLRYVGVYLIAIGGLWLLLDSNKGFLARLKSGISYGLIAIVVPVAWMLRNHAVDGTFTGPRYPSARGPIDNAFDILGVLGRWVLPGVADDAKYIWAAIGGVVLAIAVVLGWKVLGTQLRTNTNEVLGSESDAAASLQRPKTRLGALIQWLGRPTGLLAMQAFGYLLYMLYVRSTTALNQLDMRLLNPAYLSLVALALVLIDRLQLTNSSNGQESSLYRGGLAAAYVWAAANVALGIFSAFSFLGGNVFFDGNYEAPLYRDVRADSALEALPEECVLYSNLPNALYPALEAEWSPRETGLESNEAVDDIDLLAASLAESEACLIWVDEEPDYGHLWPLQHLNQQFMLETLGESDNVTVYSIQPRS